jgi:putative nucleotidyltransferase with HDIG domain
MEPAENLEASTTTPVKHGLQEPAVEESCGGIGLRNGTFVGSRYRQAHAAGRPRVLIVDDEEGVRNLLYKVLATSYDCDRAASGREAIAKVEAESFDVVLSDIMMPNGTGLDLLEHVQRTQPRVAVILVTAVSDTKHALKAIRMGAFDYLLKPFDIEEIELGVSRAVRYQALVGENEFYQSQLEALVVERTSELRETNERLEGLLLEMSLCYRATVSALTTALESRDRATRGNTERVAAFARRLGAVMGLDEGQLAALEQGALLHDVGMIYVPDQIVRKPGKLEPAEWEQMRCHTEYGAQILREIGFLTEAVPVVEQHHERWDGTGYPRALRGEQIDLKARIFAVADSLEAMTSGRPYRGLRNFQDAAAELRRCAGTQFDPAVVDAFFAIPLEDWEAMRNRVAARRADR